MMIFRLWQNALMDKVRLLLYKTQPYNTQISCQNVRCVFVSVDNFIWQATNIAWASAIIINIWQDAGGDRTDALQSSAMRSMEMLLINILFKNK